MLYFFIGNLNRRILPVKDTVIISGARTPIGSFNGSLSSVPVTRLGSIAIEEAIKRGGIHTGDVDEVIMGHVLSAGVGQAPARQAALGAGLPNRVGATTINKVCGSGLKAVMLAAQAISCNDAEVIVAGGMESMSRTPYLLDGARRGYRMGHGQVIDSMIKDGLWDVYNDFHMGSAAELCVDKFSFTRAELDEYAMESYNRAIAAQNGNRFSDEIVPVEIVHGVEKMIVDEDDEPKRVRLDGFASLKPAFKKDGKITAGNSSHINDGAAAVVVTSAEKASLLGIRPVARIIGYASSALAPEWFTIAPVEAIKDVLKRTGLSIKDIDLFEINEAFAAVSLAVNRELGLDPAKVNVKGGAIALGHPIGASGARLLVTLLYALRDYDKRIGLASLCIGGGEAVAMIVERFV